jgi:hypothetical protein
MRRRSTSGHVAGCQGIAGRDMLKSRTASFWPLWSDAARFSGLEMHGGVWRNCSVAFLRDHAYLSNSWSCRSLAVRSSSVDQSINPPQQSSRTNWSGDAIASGVSRKPAQGVCDSASKYHHVRDDDGDCHLAGPPVRVASILSLEHAESSTVQTVTSVRQSSARLLTRRLFPRNPPAGRRDRAP